MSGASVTSDGARVEDEARRQMGPESISMANTRDSRVRGAAGRGTAMIVAIIFLLSAAMAYQVFFPSLHEIGGWDEAGYINEGRELAGGTLPRLSHNPAVALLYALTYLPVRSSPYWLIHSCSIARVLLFGLLWLAGVLVASELTGLASPFIMIALIAMSPASVGLLNNGSNALFAAMSGFALWQCLLFHRTREVKHLWACSTFVGLAALSRNEGPVLFLVFLAIVLALCAPAGAIRKGITASVVPFIVLVGGYVGLYGLRTGDFTSGTQKRSYFTFEQGHGMAFAASYGTLQYYVEGANDARRLFGTAEENHYSVLTAIRRNPRAYLQRIPLLTKSAIKDMFAVYHWHFAVLCFAFAARGILELIRRRSFALLAILVLWPAYSALYVLLCYQPAHLLMSFTTLFALASLGVSAVATNLDSREERVLWSIGLLTLAIAGGAVYRQPNDLLAAPLLLLLGLWLMWLVTKQEVGERRRTATACFVLLAATLLVRFGIAHAKPRALGSAPDERATLFLRDHFRPGTAVGAYAPGKVWNANMSHVAMVNIRDLKTSEDVWQWMARERVEVIYADKDLRTFEPSAWEAIRKQVSHGLEVVAFDTSGAADRDDEAVLLLVHAPGEPHTPGVAPIAADLSSARK
jgi:hypothetical protein